MKFRLTLLEGSGRVDKVMQNTDQELILSLIGGSTAKPVLRGLAAIAKSYHEAGTTTPVLPGRGGWRGHH